MKRSLHRPGAALLFLVVLLGSPAAALAQLELKTPEKFNQLRIGGTPLGDGNPQPDTQFSSVGVSSSGDGPSATGVPASATAKISLGRSGTSFATGVPRYFLGDVIVPPATQADGVTPADTRYWRAKPVARNELFSNPDGSDLLDTKGDQLPNTTGSTGIPLPSLPAGEFEAFYYSIHADRVFASQAGTVEIWWVSSSPEGPGAGAWQFRKETFNVSGAATGAVRKVYWTEKSFNGPRVRVPGGRIVRANPVYSTNFPDVVAEEYQPQGEVVNPDPDAQPAEEKRTLWFEKLNGIGELAAYNIEGRVLVEYLGDETSPGVHTFLGADVVQVVRSAQANIVTVELGQQVQPRDGDPALLPAPVPDLGGGASNFYGTLARPDGTLVYHAERENLNPDRVVFYWLEDTDADIYLAPQPPGLSIQWPKFQDRYRFVWPDDLDAFAHVTTDTAGSTTETGVQFDPANQPTVVFQDDGPQTEARFDVEAQRLVVDFSGSGDGLNRSLLKFSTSNAVWYQPVYTQAEDRDSFVESDGLDPVASTATVGRRIAPPSDRYSLAGAVSGGTGYQPSAYIDPYTSGVEAAEAGAIIPVNARPVDNVLTVRWFEKIEPSPPNAAFTPFYVPSKVGRYTVSFPADLGAWAAAAEMFEERSQFTATRLLDGRVMVSGGYSSSNGALSSVEIYDPATGTWRQSTGTMNDGTFGSTASLLPDGKVLVTGGGNVGTRTEVFDPRTESWTLVGPNAETRYLHTATTLADGRVLVCGGRFYNGTAHASRTTAEVFDPANNTWTTVGPMAAGRQQHTATRLADGRVLVVGGHDGQDNPVPGAELFDPTTGTWSPAAAPGADRYEATATRLEDGRVLLAGGRAHLPETGGFAGIGSLTTVAGTSPDPFVFAAGQWTVDTRPTTANTFLQSPTLRTTTAGPVTLTVDHSYNFENTYDGGRVLVSVDNGPYQPVPFADQGSNVGAFGGAGNPGWTGTATSVTSSAVLFNATYAGQRYRFSFEAASDFSQELPAPNWTITGVGVDNTGHVPTVTLATSELYDPSGDSWSDTAGPLADQRNWHTSTLLPDGKVIVAGGDSAGHDSSEVFDPATTTWSSAGALSASRSLHTAVLLADGGVLLVGGSGGGSYLRSVERLETVSRLVMASNLGTADLTAAQAAGSIYVQNNRDATGYNPNEEHAVPYDGRFFALRDDLNITADDETYSSEPFVLVAYTDPADSRPAMRLFKVVREDARYKFDYPWTAGTRLQGPMPLPLMALPTVELSPGVTTVRNTEVDVTPDPSPDRTVGGDTLAVYDRFTFQDRKGHKWVYRGPHDGGTPGFGMKWYYKMRDGFFFPGRDNQPAPGTNLPYLRPAGSAADPVTGDALTVNYRPTWPENPPSLRVAETLTLPKYGLPDVRNQASATVLYQQSIARDGPAATSVLLHDPTRQKIAPLDEAGLDAIPASVRTSTYQGKTYFQGLPPHLQRRFYFDPFASVNGSLFLVGEFHDVIAGEDYLDLNVLSDADETALKALAENEDAAVQANWEGAINALTTRLETFIEDPDRRGTYKVDIDNTKTFDVGPTDLAVLPDEDTARDSYALTASGKGDGYLTLLFGNGEVPNLTPEGDPVAMQVVRVVPDLYNGDLKVRLSSNPLDEQVTLRHSGDFAAAPEDYEFQWRHAPPAADGTQPPTYSYTRETVLGDPGDADTRQWLPVQNPAAALPSAAVYPIDGWDLPRTVTVRDSDYDTSSNHPGLVLKAAAGADFTTGVPANLVFSAETGDLDGFALYVNGTIALVHANGVAALTPLLGQSAYELKLARAASVDDLPVEGERLFVVAEVDGVLHFRVFDANGVLVVERSEPQLLSKQTALQSLKGTLTNLWATTNLLRSDKAAVVTASAAILDFDLDTQATTGLSGTGLTKQFSVDPGFFLKGPNRIEVALYSNADVGRSSDVDFRLEGSTKTDLVSAGAPWQTPTGTLENIVTVGGDATSPLGSPLLVMSDNFFTMRYRPKEGVNVLRPTGSAFGPDDGWSDWTRPALVEGWIKRVVAAINPFNQRVRDLFNNAVNTDVSLLTQAGTKWEGDIALTLDAIDDTGLIAIYETVLNRGKEISIGSGYDYGPANDALLLAAGYLNDLYTVLGNEAFADAANPTISVDDADTVTEINTSRYSFEGQVGSVLAEELALLRGRDDFLSPQVTQSPFYNRLFWNYTRGIDSGEAIYATNYNIKEKVGSANEDGNIDAADAQRMFPQGHGDAYGHYLTALKGYYKLLTDEHFTWVPRSESLNILDNTVSVDYQDERKFAAAAANVARTAEQVLTLTHRQRYHDEPADGWSHFRDGATGGEFNDARHWGLDEWASRSGQGAYYHWVVGNAMVPDVDPDHPEGSIQKIDRTTVPELERLALSGTSLQDTLDNANAHLNPLGLSPGAIAFDIDPVAVKGGQSHYEQVYDRALQAVLNAKGAFDQAAKMTRLLRNQENQIDDFNTAIQEQERAFTYQLIDLYGSPYPGDVGPGKTYAQGYAGPDLNNWFLVDRSSALLDIDDAITFNARLPVQIAPFQGFTIEAVTKAAPDALPTGVGAQAGIAYTERQVTLRPNQFGQFVDEWLPGTDLGSRRITGRVQQAIQDAQLAYVALQEAQADLENDYHAFDRKVKLFLEVAKYHVAVGDAHDRSQFRQTTLSLAGAAATIAAAYARAERDSAKKVADAASEAPPHTAGTSTDATSGARAAIQAAAAGVAKTFNYLAIAADVTAKAAEVARARQQRLLEKQLEEMGFGIAEQQLAYELEVELNRVLDGFYTLTQLAGRYQQAAEEVRTVLALGDRLQLERQIFRKRAATVVQGYRTNDLTFRTFRNEALEQYRTLFDLAGRYTYLAANSYDYETGLLGTPQGKAAVNRIVAARALGDLTDGQPQATVSTLGDAGLAGTMAQLQADWAVAEGRLGINNPDETGTLFSLRNELFRIADDPAKTDDDARWRQTIERHIVADLMGDPDAATHCRNLRKPDGSAVPGILIPFSSTIEHGKNFFGLPSAGGDHAFSPSNFATKIYSAGVVLEGYVGMDPYAEFIPGAGEPATNDPNALSATPYLYLVPVGVDKMLAPPLGDTGVVRTWNIRDQALPLPYNLGANAFSTTQFFDANDTLSAQPWVLRKHQAFRPVDDPVFFYSGLHDEFDSARLVGRSVWNTQWKIIIPAYALLNDEQEGLDRFAATVSDIKLFLRAYSHSGN